nr:uncharacterized mitochondrial protein AtMg00810-like [Lolium perenne]
MYLLVYVDNIILVSSSSSAADLLIQSLRSEFAVKDLGPLRYFLGLEVSPVFEGLSLMQKKYALDLLRRVGMLKCTPVSTPMAATEKLSCSDGDLLSAEDATRYRSIVGGLQYLLVTRPDLSYEVNKVCQYMQSPHSPHWDVVKRILRYVSFTVSHGVHLRASSSSFLSAFSDVDWAGNSDDRRSKGGGACHILWSELDRLECSQASHSVTVEYGVRVQGTC